MRAGLRLLYAALAASSLTLAGCTTLLGDFKYDPNGSGSGGSSSSSGKTADEQGKIVILPNAGLVTTEQGAKATFTIFLKDPPTSNVAIAFESSNEAEGLVSPISVSFTPDNFDAPQTVQITGVDDELPDMNQIYTIRTSPATSQDANYFGLDPLDVEVVNVDDETAGFLVTPTSGLVTSESGTEASFSIVLNHQPTADVTIALGTDKANEGTVSLPSLVFTPLNWMAPQLVTVTGIDDDAADGAQLYHVVTGAAVSADAAYDKLDPVDVEVTNQDNDTPGITLTPATGLITFESGAMTTFGIALSSPPISNVVIPLSSNDTNEGTITPTSVEFTPLNWMAPQIVTVTGVDDTRADGNQLYKVITEPAISADSGYSEHNGPDVELVNIDDDSPGLTVTPTMGVTTEKGEAATFTVALASKPRGSVLIDLVSTRPEEGLVTPIALTFTEENWNAPQIVTVTGVDDPIADGMQTYTVHVTPNPSSADQAYASLLETDVFLSNTDDDSPGITLVAEPGLTTTEAGGAATFTLALNSQPRANVSIGLVSNDTSEGTVSPAQVVFTPDNYGAPQVVTVKGVNDDRADGHQPFRIITQPASSEDIAYASLNAPNVDLTNLDDDSPGIWVVPSNQTLVTSERAGTATFTVVLNSEPSGGVDVTIPVSSSNTAEGTVSPSSLRFTPGNWRAPQTVTVKGVNDDFADGAQVYRVVLGAAVSSDPNYNGRDALDVTVRNTDDDSPGISLTGTANLTTTERGGAASFQIVLNSKPTSNVSVGLSSSRTGEGTVSPSNVTFTTSNWSAPQIVTITGVNDNVVDGNQQYRVVTAAATSQDSDYGGWDPADPGVTNVDDDSPGITLTPTSAVNPLGQLLTREGGGTGSFTIVLNSQPTADVTVPLHSSNPSEGTLSPASVTFTAANWNAPRTITVTGADDSIADGAQPYSIVTDEATSADDKYTGLDARDLPMSNVDDDSPGIDVSAVTPASGRTFEDPNALDATFTVRLESQPQAPVTIPLASSDETEGTVAPSSVTFTPENWSAAQKITVTGVQDMVADGNQTYSVSIGPASSADEGYAGLTAADVPLTNVDQDSASVNVGAASDTTEDPADQRHTTMFTIALNSRPTANVSIPLSSSDPSEASVSPASLVFTSSDWNSPRTVTVTGVDDDLADGDQPYTILIGAASSADEAYDELDANDVELTNIDDDSAAINVGNPVGQATENGDSMSFDVVLSSKPTANVTIPVSSSDVTEVSVAPTSLIFTPDNWDIPQAVEATGLDDDIADGDQTYTVVLGAASSADSDYNGMDPRNVSASNTDFDSPEIIVVVQDASSSEAGATASFSIVLRTRPTAPVTVPLSSSNPNEGSLAVDSVTFTPGNWDTAQEVTVSGEDDDVADGTQDYKIVTGPADSGDPNYDNRNADDVLLHNADDADSAGIEVTVNDEFSGEDGDTASFTVVLSSQPTGPVSIPIASSNPNEGELAASSINFTTANWGIPQEVEVTGVDDSDDDGDQDYEIMLGMPTSSDPDYAAIDPDDAALTNIDDDAL